MIGWQPMRDLEFCRSLQKWDDNGDNDYDNDYDDNDNKLGHNDYDNSDARLGD